MEVGGGEYDYQRQQVAGSYFWQYPLPVVDRLIRGFFLYLDIWVEKVCFRRAEASSTISLRSQTMPYTVNNNGNNDHSTGYHHQQSRSVSGTTASSKPFCSLQTSISILGSLSNNNSLLPSQVPPSASQLHNLSRVLSASGSSQPSIRQPSFFFHLVWVTTHSDRGAELWIVGSFGDAGNACGSSEDESIS